MPLTAIVVGAGHRSMIYASYAKIAPDDLQIVAVVDPDPERRQLFQETYDLPPQRLYRDVSEIAKLDRFADVVINGTMDHLHVVTTVPLLRKGYDVLLEKPLAVNADEMNLLRREAKLHGSRILVCHVLRYAPFYQRMREIIEAGTLGDILHVSLSEMVSYHHLAVSYVRGKWADRYQCHAPMLLAKSSHDLDLMTWLMGKEPSKVASFGSDFLFTPDKAPEGSTYRCLPDCPLRDRCNYSAERLHLTGVDRRGHYVWESFPPHQPLTPEVMRHSLETDNPYGICAWKTGRRNVDHQTVQVLFKDGATGILEMIGNAAKSQRKVHIVGELGEIEGRFEDDAFELRIINPDNPQDYDVKRVSHDDWARETEGLGGGHGGGDMLMMRDFVHYIRDGELSLAATTLEDSVTGHAIAFASDVSMLEGRVVDFYEVAALTPIPEVETFDAAGDAAETADDDGDDAEAVTDDATPDRTATDDTDAEDATSLDAEATNGK